MKTLKRDHLLEALRTALCDREGILAAYLFGSRATGDDVPTSDVDVAVLFESALQLAEQVRLEAELERAAGLPVELVDLRRAAPFLALDIVRGIRFVENDPVAADEYELYVLRRAGDLAPLERERRAMLLGADR